MKPEQVCNASDYAAYIERAAAAGIDFTLPLNQLERIYPWDKADIWLGLLVHMGVVRVGR